MSCIQYMMVDLLLSFPFLLSQNQCLRCCLQIVSFGKRLRLIDFFKSRETFRMFPTLPVVDEFIKHVLFQIFLCVYILLRIFTECFGSKTILRWAQSASVTMWVECLSHACKNSHIGESRVWRKNGGRVRCSSCILLWEGQLSCSS